jgi:hypothetical protein
MLEYLPPRSAREITIDGFAVPHIEARESPDGLVCSIFLDGRFLIIPRESRMTDSMVEREITSSSE